MKQLWNKGWKVWKDENAFSIVFTVPSHARDVDLPHDALFETSQKEDSVNKGRTGHLDQSTYHYYKTLTPKENKNYMLEFEGVASEGYVNVNGSLAYSNHYAYNDFIVDITPYLNMNEENNILVVANGCDLNTRYYVGNGIFKDVYLIEVDDIYIKPNSFKLTTKEVYEHKASVQIEFTICSNHRYTKYCDVVLKQGDKIIDQFPVMLLANSEKHIHKYYMLEDIELWDDLHPNLYTFSIEMNDDVDYITTGIRKLTLDHCNGLCVNHRSVKLRGACIHHDQGLLGAKTTYDYEYYRISKLKEAGFNAIRSAHNPVSRSLLKACDILGMYVMDEVVDVWFKMKNHHDYATHIDEYETIIRSMVDVDYNHPSVILYSTGNEVSNINTTKGYELSYRMSELFHQLDDTRYTTNGINGAFAAGDEMVRVASDLTGKPQEFFKDGDINKFMGIMATQMSTLVKHDAITEVLSQLSSTMDILGYNYMTSRYEDDTKTYPHRMIVGSETYPKQIAENWHYITQLPQVIGDFTWTGYDYLGEVGAYPTLVNTGGDISIIGTRRPISYYREIVFGLCKDPYIAIRNKEQAGTPRNFGPWKYTDALNRYDFDDQDLIEVEVYFKGDYVELYQNDKLIDTKYPSDKDPYYVSFMIHYQEGTIKAISYENNQEVGTYAISSPKEVAYIKDHVYKGELMHIIDLSIYDKNHHRVTHTAELDVVCDGTIYALASHDTPYDCGFRNNHIDVKLGEALLIVSSDTKEVSIKVNGIQHHIKM